MGDKFMVYSWVDGETDQMEYILVYGGESMEEALKAAFNEKANGVGCVKIEWRQ